MAITRKFANGNELTDYTDEVLVIPNEWGLLKRMGLFSESGVTQHSVTFDRTVESLAVLQDKRRGERQAYSKDEDNQTFIYAIPHFPFDDYITVEDLQGVRMNGTAANPEDLANVRNKKLERIRKSHAATLEKARIEALKGTIYAPNGTVAGNYYTDFGLTQKDVDFDLGTAGTDVIAKGEEVIVQIQDNIQDGTEVEDFVAICDPVFFGKLISHAGVAEAYKFYEQNNQQGNQVLRDRLGTGKFRQFSHGGIVYVEYRGSFGGVPLLAADEAYCFPTGTDGIFETKFSPAHKLSLANTVGREVYAFESEVGNDTGMQLESESNMINLIKRPEVVVKLSSST